jgi:hypothetical protein
MRIGVCACAAVLAAGCGGQGEPPASHPTESELRHQGISIAVPEGWDGRVLFTDAAGEGPVMFQVANFALPLNEGLEPPQELPPGQEDPIKAMTGDDLLVMISTDQVAVAGRAGPPRISEQSFLARGSPRIPHGHDVAEELGCVHGRCVRVTVDFASPPSRDLIDAVNDVLASLTIGERP